MFLYRLSLVSSESGWNNATLQGAFYRGLQELVKDELATWDDTVTVDQLISLSIRLDNRLQERKRERAPRLNDVTSQLRIASESPAASPSSDLSPEPMQLGHARLSTEEQANHWNANLCLYCRKPGHCISSCPARPVKAWAHHLPGA